MAAIAPSVRMVATSSVRSKARRDAPVPPGCSTHSLELRIREGAVGDRQLPWQVHRLGNTTTMNDESVRGCCGEAVIGGEHRRDRPPSSSPVSASRDDMRTDARIAEDEVHQQGREDLVVLQCLVGDAGGLFVVMPVPSKSDERCARRCTSAPPRVARPVSRPAGRPCR